MVLQNGEKSSDILESQAHIWNHLFNFINSMSLKCAIQLQIPDIINRHGSPMTLPELVEALLINKEKSLCVYRLMRILVHSGFFIKQNISSKTGDLDEAEAYLLAPASRLLLKDEPFNVSPFLLAMLDPVLMDPWHHLSKWFQNDATSPFETAHGRTFWDYAGNDPKLNLLFNDGMASDTRLVADVVIKNCRGSFEGLNSIVDVAGGTGTFAKAIANAFPDVSCINFDLPHVVAGLQGSKNMSYISGDMFQLVPPANSVLLKWILHDWSDKECIKILKKCKEAIPSKEKGGKLIIIDMVVNDEEGVGGKKALETQLYFDLLMMVSAKGRERTEKEWAKLFSDAGFNSYKISPVLGLRSLIEVYP